MSTSVYTGLKFASRASPCAITFQLDCTVAEVHSDFPNALCVCVCVRNREERKVLQSILEK